MAAKVKVDQIETVDGSGNITINNSVTMASNKTLPAASVTGTHTSFTSTGIDDNADALAMTINSSEQVGIGTASPSSKLHVYDGAGANIGIQSSAGSHWRIGDAVGASNGQLIIRDHTNSANRIIVHTDGAVTMPTQPCFNISLTTELSNVLGNAVEYFLGSSTGSTENFDVGANMAGFRFTAPVTGKYQLSGVLGLGGAASDNGYGFGQIVTSNRSYTFAHSYQWYEWFGDDSGNWICAAPFSFVADMDADDTAYFRVKIWGGSTVIDVATSTYFQGYLLG